MVVLSFLERFLKYTTTFGSEIAERSGGSETYDSCEEFAPNAADEEPKAEEPNVEAARALLACDLAVRLLMAGWMVQSNWGEAGEKVCEQERGHATCVLQ